MKQKRLGAGHYRPAVAAIGAAIAVMLTGTSPIQAQAIQDRPPASALKPQLSKDLRSTLAQTAAVVEGTVTDIQYLYTEKEGPWTRVTLSKVQAHYGDAPQVVEIRHFGGPLPSGHTLVAAELPFFVKGKQYIVFLRNTAWNLSPVVGDLALRTESVGGSEVLVDADGQIVTGIGAEGVAVGPVIFGSPDLNGAAPKLLVQELPKLSSAPLDRLGFVKALGTLMADQGLRVAGNFYVLPAGEFKWRAQQTLPQPGTVPAAPDDITAPVVDTSKPKL